VWVVPKSLSPEGYGHMEGRGWASPPFQVHSCQPTPVSAPEVLWEPVDKDLGKGSV